MGIPWLEAWSPGGVGLGGGGDGGVRVRGWRGEGRVGGGPQGAGLALPLLRVSHWASPREGPMARAGLPSHGLNLLAKCFSFHLFS